MTYSKQTWNDYSTGGTPISADRLNHMEDGIAASDTGITAHLADTADAHDASAISLLDTGGYFTATDVEAFGQELPSLYGARPRHLVTP